MTAFDWILTDLLVWVRHVIWWRKQKIKKRPYEKIKTWRIPDKGLLHKVIRPQELCPRDVGSYIFEPFRYGSTATKDLHICCDHLDGMRLPTPANRGRATHRITVLIASHGIDKYGRYIAEEIFSLDDDFQGRSQRRDLHINCLLHQFANAVVFAPDLITFDFLREADSAKQYCMRSEYTDSLMLPKPTGDVIAKPVDGDRSVRIRLN